MTEYKAFIGGLPVEATDEDISNAFGHYGNIVDVVAIKDGKGKPRGFGYVAFDTRESLEAVMADYESHMIMDRWVEVKECLPREKGKGKNNNNKGGSFNKGGGKGYDNNRGGGKGYDNNRGGNKGYNNNNNNNNNNKGGGKDFGGGNKGGKGGNKGGKGGNKGGKGRTPY